MNHNIVFPYLDVLCFKASPLLINMDIPFLMVSRDLTPSVKSFTPHLGLINSASHGHIL